MWFCCIGGKSGDTKGIDGVLLCVVGLDGCWWSLTRELGRLVGIGGKVVGLGGGNTGDCSDWVVVVDVIVALFETGRLVIKDVGRFPGTGGGFAIPVGDVIDDDDCCVLLFVSVLIVGGREGLEGLTGVPSLGNIWTKLLGNKPSSFCSFNPFHHPWSSSLSVIVIYPPGINFISSILNNS